jgi:hypothetical protein
MSHLVALAAGRDEILAAVLHPFQRAAQQQRGRRQRQLLGIERGLGPEAAAGVGRHHADVLFGQSERLDHDLPRAMRHLGVGVHGQRIVDRIEPYCDAARLDRMAAALVQAEARGDAMRGLRERAVDVAVVDGLPCDEIVRAVHPRPGCARFKPGQWIGDGGQRLDIAYDQGQRVFGDAA